MARKQVQGALGDFDVEDAALVDALDVLGDVAKDTRDLKKKRAEAAKPFTKQIEEIEAEHGKADAEATAAERQAALLAQFDGRLRDGAQIRVGPYVIKVEEYEHITAVDTEPAYKLKKPMRIASDDEE